jgi:SpoVK/Ycf46/Vps4 family AAA+-type ATPase
LDSIKAEFLTLWDGVSTCASSRVMVLGATNRPQTIDPAILRRMPRSFQVPLPNEAGRLAILKLLFVGEHVDTTVDEFLPKLAKYTRGYSGSDLKEVCKAAAMVGIQERTSHYANMRVSGKDADKTIALDKLRPIGKEDLVAALRSVGRTGDAAALYGHEQLYGKEKEEWREAVQELND